ncbi:hypothetical protein ACFL6U_33145, partial [Planctomycetota bacterium]
TSVMPKPRSFTPGIAERLHIDRKYAPGYIGVAATGDLEQLVNGENLSSVTISPNDRSCMRIITNILKYSVKHNYIARCQVIRHGGIVVH